MKFIFKTFKPAARAAARLQAALAKLFPHSAEFHFKDATAFVLGHDNWATFQVSCSETAELSKLDEACNNEELAERRAFQASRLEEYCARHGLSINGAEFISNWRPSAGRPQEQTESRINAEKMRDEGRPEKCLVLLMLLESTKRSPTADEISYIIGSLPSCTGKNFEMVETYAAPLAIRMVNKQVGDEPSQGLSILEALVANGGEYSMVSLAKALRNGWGYEDFHRARSLVSAVLTKIDNDEIDFLEPSSYAELYSLAGHLWLHGHGGGRDGKKGFEFYRMAAHMGSGEAALLMTSFLMPLPAGEEPDMFSGIVEPDEKLAEAYFEQALKRGYDPKTKRFGKVKVA